MMFICGEGNVNVAHTGLLKREGGEVNPEPECRLKVNVRDFSLEYEGPNNGHYKHTVALMRYKREGTRHLTVAMPLNPPDPSAR